MVHAYTGPCDLLSKRRSRFVGSRVVCALSFSAAAFQAARHDSLRVPATALRAILEIAFAHIHSRFRTYNDLCSLFRSWRPERQQSLHCRPTALRCRPISLASHRRTAAPPRVSRQSRHARRRVDHHVPCAPDAGGQSSRSPGTTERTDRPRASRAENPPPQSAYARLQGPSAHGKIATVLLQETARPGRRRLSWRAQCSAETIRKAAAVARFRDAAYLENERRRGENPKCVPIGVDGGQCECEVRRRTARPINETATSRQLGRCVERFHAINPPSWLFCMNTRVPPIFGLRVIRLECGQGLRGVTYIQVLACQVSNIRNRTLPAFDGAEEGFAPIRIRSAEVLAPA